MIIIDSHEDLAYNILSFGRDYTLPVAGTRAHEQGSPTIDHNGDTLLGRDAYVEGRVAVVIATLFSLPAPLAQGPWERLTYRSPAEAYHLNLRQVDAYRRLAGDHPSLFRLVQNGSDLRETIQAWEAYDQRERLTTHKTAAELKDAPDEQPPADEAPPVGLVMSIEGADGVREPKEVEFWWEQGVRLIGPAWAGTRYSGGTNQPGPLTPLGRELLEEMGAFGFGLDISHMDEEAARQAIDLYPGPVLASHSNAAALLKGDESNRHLPDRVISGLIERDGLIGIVPANFFLKPGWKPIHGREAVSLAHVAAQIDYICQAAGDARHAAVGTDFDGGFGWQQVPAGIDTIADLQKLPSFLSGMGYTNEDIALILSGNTARLLRRIFQEAS